MWKKLKKQDSLCTKYGTKKVERCTMFDINKALMRCLVKNLAVFGLGISLYIGDDLISQNEANSANIENKKEIKYVNDEQPKWLIDHNLVNYLKNKQHIDDVNKCPYELYMTLLNKYNEKQKIGESVNGGN